MVDLFLGVGLVFWCWIAHGEMDVVGWSSREDRDDIEC